MKEVGVFYRDEQLASNAVIHKHPQRMKRKGLYGMEVGHYKSLDFDPCEQVIVILDGDDSTIGVAKSTVIYIHGY